MITRIFSDADPEQVGALVNQIAFDGGTWSTQDQGNGKVTVIAVLPGDPPPEAALPSGTAEFPWMPIARGEIGVKETPQNNPRISEYFTATALGSQPETVPWCSAFVNWCVKRSGHPGTGIALARSWLNWGRPTADLVPGCIVVLQRGTPTQGHVGFYVGVEGGFVRLLGGNQHDAVNIASFPRERVLGRRIL